MSFSLNEVHMTLRKALCGRGLAYGVADEFGAVGARLSSGETCDGVQAVLALNNDALIARLHHIEAALAGADQHALADPLDARLVEQLTGAPFPRARACAISEASWEQALALSHLTYVPESESSRLGGAGAGTNDND
ncbi:MAG: hypothetical protein ACPG42_08545 [Alphaproteobacteria bacterium]